MPSKPRHPVSAFRAAFFAKHPSMDACPSGPAKSRPLRTHKKVSIPLTSCEINLVSEKLLFVMDLYALKKSLEVRGIEPLTS